jgi:hypothetical protein
MSTTARRALATAAALGITGGALALTAPAASAAPQIKTVSGATYVSFSDLAASQFHVIRRFTEQVNEIVPGDEEVVFAVDKSGPRSAVGLFNPIRPGISLAVECDPAVDTWESYLAGSCSGNEESLLP